MRPGNTPESRENQLIAKAVDLAEKQLSEGTASSQVITHYLKLGTTVAQLEKEKLTADIAILKAKTEAIEATKRAEETYKEAISAFRGYSGQEEPEYEDDDY